MIFVSLQIFSNLSFSKFSISNSFDPDLVRYFVRQDLVPDILQRLSAGDKNLQLALISTKIRKKIVDEA